jgi:hypothetical protein
MSTLNRFKTKIFHACGECGGGAPSGALICNPDYYSMGSLTRVRLIGVGLGADCQQFLKRAALEVQGGIGFVFMGNDGQAFTSQAPELSLPFLNPAVSSVFPDTGSWKSLIVGVGSEPQAWRMMMAPSSGEKVVTTKDGLFMLSDPASSSGSTAVCYQDGNVGLGNIIVCVKTGVDENSFPVYGLSKLTVLHKHPVEGFIDPDTGLGGFRAIPSDKEITHPFARFDLMRHASFNQYDAVTQVDDAGGMAPQPQTGGGAVTDAELVVYSPTTHKFYRLPERTKETLTVGTDVVVADSGAYVSMGGHCLWNNLQFNFPDYLFTCSVRINAGGGTPSYDHVTFGLFVDGVMVNEWDTKNSQNVALSYVGTGLTVGQHTVELKFKQTTDPDSTMTIRFSTGTISTLL